MALRFFHSAANSREHRFLRSLTTQQIGRTQTLPSTSGLPTAGMKPRSPTSRDLDLPEKMYLLESRKRASTSRREVLRFGRVGKTLHRLVCIPQHTNSTHKR